MKRIAIFILLIAMTLSITACQKVPETSLVVGKSSDKLIEKAQTNSGEEPLSARLDTPGTYQESVSSEDGLLNLTIDATITVPEANSIPIIQVTPGAFSQEQADVLINELAHNTLYSPNQPMTKEEITEELLAAKQALAAGPADNDILFLNEGLEVWEQAMQEYIDMLNAGYQDAPETVDPEPISDTFIEFDNGASQIEGINTSSEVGFEGLQISNIPFGQGTTQALYSQNTTNDGFELAYVPIHDMIRYFPDIDLSQFPEISLSEEDAQALCDELVEKLGLADVICWSVYKAYSNGNPSLPARSCWEVRYVRNMNGVPITFTATPVSGTLDANGNYFAPWLYESLVFYVTDDGIIGMKWQSPYEIGDAVTKDSALLSFNEVMDVFRKMFLVDNAGEKKDVTVNSIRLGYTRVLKQDETGVGLLVPVWDFFGSVTDEEGRTSTSPDNSLLTINAVDGSIIDRAVGY